MTYSPTLALTLIKAAQHKYTHKKRVGTDKKGRARYRYSQARSLKRVQLLNSLGKGAEGISISRASRAIWSRSRTTRDQM
jgi:hypothetical protein